MKIHGNINLNNKNMYIWKVNGWGGHRLKNSFSESYIQSMEDGDYKRPIIIGELNSDVLGTNFYNLFIIFAENEESALDELDGQLSDGAYENTYYTGTIERIL